MKKCLFMFMLLVFPISILLANSADSRRMIHLKVKKKVIHRSIEASPIDAFVTGSLLEISFNTPFNEATISVLDSKTGEQVYHTTTSDNFVAINLREGDYCTEYLLSIILDGDTIITGEFEMK